MILLSILIMCLAVYCYACAELQRQGQLRWQTKGHGFFGEDSYLRKYKNIHKEKGKFQVAIPLDNWYYNLFEIKYREAFPLSSTLLVFVTDFYHHMQFWMFNFISLSLTLALGWNLWLFIGLMFGIRIVHWSGRKVFKK